MPDSRTPPGDAGYEFSRTQNEALADLARVMRAVGFWFVLYGALLLVWFAVRLVPRDGQVTVDVTGLLSGLLYVLLGVFARRGGRTFSEIVETEGSDVRHLMGAVAELSRFFGLIRAVVIALLALLLVGAAALLVPAWLAAVR